MFQSNQMASVLKHEMGIPGFVTGILFAGLAWIVLVGGIKRIGEVTSKIVPVMVLFYFITALGILWENLAGIPSLLTNRLGCIHWNSSRFWFYR